MEFVQRMIRCGKKDCKKCPHGPYWYGSYFEDGKTRWKYIGKKLVIPPDYQESEPDA